MLFFSLHGHMTNMLYLQCVAFEFCIAKPSQEAASIVFEFFFFNQMFYYRCIKCCKVIVNETCLIYVTTQPVFQGVLMITKQ